MQLTFAIAYPNIAWWVKDNGAFIAIGYDYNTDSYARALDEGGMVWSGGEPSDMLDELLKSLDDGIASAMEEIGLSR